MVGSNKYSVGDIVLAKYVRNHTWPEPTASIIVLDYCPAMIINVQHVHGKHSFNEWIAGNWYNVLVSLHGKPSIGWTHEQFITQPYDKSSGSTRELAG